MRPFRWWRRRCVIRLECRSDRQCAHPSLFQLLSQVGILTLKTIIFDPKVSRVAAAILSSAGEIERRRRNVNKEAGNEQASGKGQEERQDSFQYSKVQHAISPHKAYINVYAAFSNLVSKVKAKPTTILYL